MHHWPLNRAAAKWLTPFLASMSRITVDSFNTMEKNWNGRWNHFIGVCSTCQRRSFFQKYQFHWTILFKNPLKTKKIVIFLLILWKFAKNPDISIIKQIPKSILNHLLPNLCINNFKLTGKITTLDRFVVLDFSICGKTSNTRIIVLLIRNQRRTGKNVLVLMHIQNWIQSDRKKIHSS